MKDKHILFGFGDTLERQLKRLPEESQLKFFWAITRYGLYQEDTTFGTAMENVVWEGMKDAIDNFGGTRRGAPRGNKNAEKGGEKSGGPAADGEQAAARADGTAGEPEGETIENNSKQFDELNSIENNSKQFDELNSIENNSKQFDELNSIQNNSKQFKTIR